MDDTAPSHISRRDSDDEAPVATAAPATSETSKNDTNQDQDTSYTLFVSGVAPAVTEDDLRELFSPYGTLVRVQIMRDPHRPEPHRGFAFVAFTNQADGEKAIAELHGTMWRERRLAVEVARRSRPHAPTPGRYNGRKEGERHGGGRSQYRGRSPRRRLRSRSPADSRHHYRPSNRDRRSRSRSPRRHDAPYYPRGSAPAPSYPPYGYAPPPPPYGYPPITTTSSVPIPHAAHHQAPPQPPQNDPYVPERPAFYPQTYQNRRY